MRNNSRKINRKYAFLKSLLFPLLCSDMLIWEIFISICQYRKRCLPNQENILPTLFFCCGLTNLDSSLTQKCQVLRQIWIIVSFLRVNCIAQSELGHSWCHLENAHLCVSLQWFIWTLFGIEANRFVRDFFSFQRQCSCYYLMKNTRSFSVLLCSADNIEVFFKLYYFCVCRITEVIFKMFLF